MALIDKLKKDLLTARKAKDKLATGVLGALVSEAVMIGKNMGNRETTDNEVLTLIAKFKKGALENLGLLGGSIEKITGCKDEDSEKCVQLALEIAIYNGYLPQQLTKEEIVKEIGMYLQVNSEKANIGSVMGHFRKNFDKRYDGKELSRIINEILKG